MNGKSIFDEYNPATAATTPEATEQPADVQAGSTETNNVVVNETVPVPEVPVAPVPDTPVVEGTPVTPEVSAPTVVEATPEVTAPQPAVEPELPLFEETPATQEVVAPTSTEAIPAAPEPEVETPVEAVPTQIVGETSAELELPAMEAVMNEVKEENKPVNETVDNKDAISELPVLDSASDVPAPPANVEANNPILEPPITNPAALEPAPAAPVSQPEPQPEPVVESAPTPAVEPTPAPEPQPEPPAAPVMEAAPIPVPVPQVQPEPQPQVQPVQPMPTQNSQFINNAPTNNKPKKPKGGIDDDVLVMAYVGKKYDKISKRIFNIPAFLFTSFYLFFRKMFGLGIVVFLISFALMNFINIPGIFLVVNLLLGFGFNKIYMASVRKRVNKLKEKNQYMRIEDIKDMCISKGGTSVGKIFLGLIVEMILAFVIGIAMVIFGITTLFGDLFSGFNIDFDFANTNKTNDKYEGMFIYNSSINMFSEFSIDIPGKFNENASDYSYEYSFRGDEGVFNECSFKLFVPNGYVDSEDLIYQMNDFFKDSEPTDVTKETINGKVWYNFMTTDSIGESYYYGTNKGKKVYIFEYDVQADAPEECINYKDEVLKSLRSK